MFLGVLMAILLFVWWGNLKLLLPGQIGRRPTDITKSGGSGPIGNGLAPGYREPTRNPFQRPDPLNRILATTPPSPASRTPETRPALPYELVGVLREGRKSQVVVVSAEGQSSLLDIEDSLCGWTLTTVKDTFVILRNGRWRDTLHLAPAAR